jgi:hypothetical protein
MLDRGLADFAVEEFFLGAIWPGIDKYNCFRDGTPLECIARTLCPLSYALHYYRSPTILLK